MLTDTTSAGACFCPGCRPDHFPPERLAPVRVSGAHFGVRFGDVTLNPYLDGERLDGCVEVMCGEHGWAIVMTRDAGGGVVLCCQCGTVPAEIPLRGNVSVERVMRR